MVLGVGADLMMIEHLSDACLRPGDPFLAKTFTGRELLEADARPDRKTCLAGRFAGKEAVYKALGGAPARAELNCIEILHGEGGIPRVALYGAFADAAREKGISAVHLSLSYDGGFALAFAVAESAT